MKFVAGFAIGFLGGYWVGFMVGFHLPRVEPNHPEYDPYARAFGEWVTISDDGQTIEVH